MLIEIFKVLNNNRNFVETEGNFQLKLNDKSLVKHLEC